MKLLFKLIPWLFVALFGAEIIAVMAPRKDGEYHVRAFGRLPVLLNGRVQPIDSVARNSLLVIRGRQSVALTNGGSLSATDWLVGSGVALDNGVLCDEAGRTSVTVP